MCLLNLQNTKRPLCNMVLSNRAYSLFGSFVRDEATIKSDVDFMVEFEDGKKIMTIIWSLPFIWKIS